MCLSAALIKTLPQRCVCCNERYYRVCVCRPSPPHSATVQHLTGLHGYTTLSLTVTQLSALLRLSASSVDHKVTEADAPRTAFHIQRDKVSFSEQHAGVVVCAMGPSLSPRGPT